MKLLSPSACKNIRSTDPAKRKRNKMHCIHIRESILKQQINYIWHMRYYRKDPGRHVEIRYSMSLVVYVPLHRFEGPNVVYWREMIGIYPNRDEPEHKHKHTHTNGYE